MVVMMVKSDCENKVRAGIDTSGLAKLKSTEVGKMKLQ